MLASSTAETLLQKAPQPGETQGHEPDHDKYLPRGVPSAHGTQRHKGSGFRVQALTRLGSTGSPSGAGGLAWLPLPASGGGGAAPASVPRGRHSAAYSLRAREIMCAAITLLTPAGRPPQEGASG